MDDILKRTSKGYKIGSSGAALAILCFFLPWVLVSCGGQQVKMSGWQLAAGTTIGEGYFAQRIPGKPVLFLVLLAGFGVFALAYLTYKRGTLTPMDGYGPIGLGVLPLVILLAEFSGSKGQAAQQGVYFEYQFGLWGVVVGYIAVIVGGIFNLKELTKWGPPRDTG